MGLLVFLEFIWKALNCDIYPNKCFLGNPSGSPSLYRWAPTKMDILIAIIINRFV